MESEPNIHIVLRIKLFYNEFRLILTHGGGFSTAQKGRVGDGREGWGNCGGRGWGEVGDRRELMLKIMWAQ